jgi:hypothetical protein
LDALEDRLLDLTNDEDPANCTNLKSQVARLDREFDEVSRKEKKNKVDAPFEEIRRNLDEARLAQQIFGDRRALLNSIVFLPGDDLPPPL